MQPCRTFLLTYGSSCVSISHEMFSSYDKLEVDECYTLTQRDLKYTLIHSRKRATRIFMTNVMIDLDESHGIKRCPLFGYETVSMGNEVEKHPGHRLIVEHMNSKSDLLECWMLNGSLQTNTRGILHSFVLTIGENQMTRAQLLNHVDSLKRKLEEQQGRISELESYESEIFSLRKENRRLKHRLRFQTIMATGVVPADEPSSPES